MASDRLRPATQWDRSGTRSIEGVTVESYSQPEDRKVRVVIEAADYTCEGLVHLPGIRLSDVMNEKNQFLVVVEAEMRRKRPSGADQPPVEVGTIFINKDDIKYILPKEEVPRDRLAK